MANKINIFIRKCDRICSEYNYFFQFTYYLCVNNWKIYLKKELDFQICDYC